MFYNLHTTWQLVILLAAGAVFAAASWRWPRWSGALVVFLAPLYLLKINGLPLTVLEMLMWLFVLVRLTVKIKKRQSGRWQEIFSGYRRGFWPALVFILAGVFFASVFSLDWRVSFGVFKAYFIAPLVFGFVLAEEFGEGGLKSIFWALFGSAVAVAMISCVYLVSGRLTFDGRLAAWYLSPNHLAMWLAPGAVAGLALWLAPLVPPCERRIKGWPWLFAFSYLLLAVALYFTYSYGAWLGLAAAAAFIAVCSWKIGALGVRRLLLSGGLLFVAGLVFFISQLNGGGKLAELFGSSRSSWQSRLMIWQSALLILKDHWLLGIGPGLFQKYYLAYQQYFSVPYLEWAVPQPHNLFLAWWLQAGLAGLLGFLWAVANFFKRAAEAAIKQPLMVLSMAVMVYCLVHGLADTTFWKNDLALTFWLIVILSSREVRRAG